MTLSTRKSQTCWEPTISSLLFPIKIDSSNCSSSSCVLPTERGMSGGVKGWFVFAVEKRTTKRIDVLLSITWSFSKWLWTVEKRHYEGISFSSFTRKRKKRVSVHCVGGGLVVTTIPDWAWSKNRSFIPSSFLFTGLSFWTCLKDDVYALQHSAEIPLNGRMAIVVRRNEKQILVKLVNYLASLASRKGAASVSEGQLPLHSPFLDR